MSSNNKNNQDDKEPSDERVQAGILSILSTGLAGHTYVRPNKLRKMICRQVTRTTWTQFARCLEELVKDARITMDNNSQKEEERIVVPGGAVQQPVSPEEDGEPQPKKQKTLVVITGDNQTKGASKNIRVPRAIALHLVRRGNLKKNNIEINTKTKLTIHGIGKTSQGLPLDELVTVQITTTIETKSEKNDSTKLQPQQQQKDKEKDASASPQRNIAKKHLQSAALLIQNMIDSYQKHPDRFAPKKAGGTLEEQAHAHEEQAARAAAQNKRHAKFGSSPTSTSRRNESTAKGSSSSSRHPAPIPHPGAAKPHTSKRKKERFY